MNKSSDKVQEVEDPEEVLAAKIKQLAAFVRKSKKTVVYTGAGISTSADIPDYRGPQGVWTLAFQNKNIDRKVDMRKANPTFTHMFLKELQISGKVKHILSQNCDGLHLRSGVPQSCLSEVHGNMYIEICTKCEPQRQYIRSFDCTVKSGFKKHLTGRSCDVCKAPLQDTIVHFGEVGKSEWPQNWNAAYDALEDVDLIICMGTSLNVLKHYKFLWPDPSSNAKLVIINLQWTAKDKVANLKINARCDLVMAKLQNALNMVTLPYCRRCDPVLSMEPSGQRNLKNVTTDCSCGNPCLASPSTSSAAEPIIEQEQTQPGWWAAEIVRMKANAPQAKAQSPEDSGVTLRKRKKAGRKKNPVRETDFEKTIRLAVIGLVENVAAATEPTRRRGRGKKRYHLSIEKPGSFKFVHCDEDEASPSNSIKKPKPVEDYDSGATEGGGSDSDTSRDDDPSFKIPKQMLANTFWCGPERKKRGGSGETKEWDLLPKRTRKMKPKEELPGANSPLIVVDDESPASSASATSEIEVGVIEGCPPVEETIEEMRHEVSFNAEDFFNQDMNDMHLVKDEIIKEEIDEREEEEIIDIVEVDEIKEEIVDILDIGGGAIIQDIRHEFVREDFVYREDPMDPGENHFDEIMDSVAAAIPQSHHPLIPSHLVNTSPLMLELFPAGCQVIVRINGYSCKDRSSNLGTTYILPIEMVKKLRDSALTSAVLLTGVAKFLDEFKNHPALSTYSSNDLIDLARRLREWKPSINNDSISISYYSDNSAPLDFYTHHTVF